MTRDLDSLIVNEAWEDSKPPDVTWGEVRRRRQSLRMTWGQWLAFGAIVSILTLVAILGVILQPWRLRGLLERDPREGG